MADDRPVADAPRCYFCNGTALNEPLDGRWRHEVASTMSTPIAHAGCIRRVAAWSPTHAWALVFYDAWGVAPVLGG